MDPSKSIDKVNLIAALLCDVQNVHGVVFNTRARSLTLNKIRERVRFEGDGFLTKTLPRLGKCLDRALTGAQALNANEIGLKAYPDSELPMLFGELFRLVLNRDGMVLQNPCTTAVATLRLLCYLFYKYKLPYEAKQTQKVIEQFKQTEVDLADCEAHLRDISNAATRITTDRRSHQKDLPSVAREARILLSDLFSSFDPTNIVPSHGPGAVATRQQLWDKFLWTNISSRITDVYPLDAYFYASLGAVCDNYEKFSTIRNEDLPARVVLVPKDSRGPRLISCEPVDFQWIQQGLSRAIVRHVEHHPLTERLVNFTDQQPNQIGALFGSRDGRYATLDLKEASDRVSVELVRLLFPDHVCTYLLSCRSLATVLPSGETLPLRKFAPMGSALCFPVLALSIWSILTASAPDSYTRDRILVYGDDVIVPTAFAANAIEQLESFGLLVNRDKSCTSGFFRESCGVDAFKGVDVTPVRLRTVWSPSPSPESYASWIAYANHFFDRKCYTVYDYIVEKLRHVYGAIPGEDMHLSCPSLRESPDSRDSFRRRVNKSLQKLEFNVLDLRSKPITRTIPGWSMLLRYFTEGAKTSEERNVDDTNGGSFYEPFSVRK